MLYGLWELWEVEVSACSTELGIISGTQVTAVPAVGQGGAFVSPELQEGGGPEGVKMLKNLICEWSLPVRQDTGQGRVSTACPAARPRLDPKHLDIP